MKYHASVKTPFSNLGLRFDNDVLIGVDFLRDSVKVKPVNKTAEKVCKQISDYASGKKQSAFNGGPGYLWT